MDNMRYPVGAQNFEYLKNFVFILSLLIFVSFGCSKEEKEDVHTDLYEEIRHIDRMEFASLAVTKTVKTERTEWYKVGKRIAVYSYDTYLKAYIDLNELLPEDLEFDDKEKIVRVTLPPVRVELDGRDMELKKEYENIGLFRSEIDSKERVQMKEKANADLKKELEGEPEYKRQLEETARRKARSYFETLFKNAGYTAMIRFSDEVTTGDIVRVIEN